MALPDKQKVKEAQQEAEKRLKDLKVDYQQFLNTPGGQDYVQHLTSLAEGYFRSAMNEIERDKKAVLVDTASGIMKALSRLTEMGKPDSAKRSSKRPKKGAKNSA